MRNPTQRWRAVFPLSVGFAAIIILLGGLGAWGAGTEIAGAIVAPGTVEVQRERQIIQHPDGGVVGEIRARDGDTVAAGDVLVRLDGTFLLSELAIVENQLAEIFARTARLSAERDGLEAPRFDNPPDIRTVEPSAFSALTAGQQSLFQARIASLAREERQLSQQQLQIRRQIEGLNAQRTATVHQRDLINDELDDVELLVDRGLAQAQRLLELQRAHARLEGELGNLTARVAEAEARRSALSLEILRLSDNRREDAISRLRDLNISRAELTERQLSLLERIARLDVRAPVAGSVFASSVVAEQSVVEPAQPMMFIIPTDRPLEVSARIDPNDVDQVYIGQDATLVFTSFNHRRMSDLSGRLAQVSADAVVDNATGQPYYQAIVVLDEATISETPDLNLRPGMPVEVFIRTENRTPLSYLTRPLTAYFQRAFLEE